MTIEHMSYFQTDIEEDSMTYPCELQEQPTRPTLSIRFKAPVQELPQHFGRIYGPIGQYLGQLGEQHAGAPFAIYYNMDMQNLYIEAGFPVHKPLRVVL